MYKTISFKNVFLIIIVIAEIVLAIFLVSRDRRENSVLLKSTINNVFEQKKSFTSSTLDFARRVNDPNKSMLVFNKRDRHTLKRDPFEKACKKALIIKPVVFRLEGIARDREIQIAIINGKVVTAGSIIDGYIVYQIGPNSVKLSNGIKDIELKF